MTTPSGMRLGVLQYWGAARGAADQRASTGEFYQAIRDAATGFGEESHGLTFQEVNQLRSAATGVRNAAERFDRAPEQNAIDTRMIGVTPYARSQDARNAMPIFTVGITLHTTDDEGEVSSNYRQIRFTGQLPATKSDLLSLVQQDAEALADTYGAQYAGHDVLEILEV